MATLLEDWRNKAYGDGLTKAEQQKLWNEYFALEKGFYEEVLSDPKHVFEGTVRSTSTSTFSILPASSTVSMIL